MIEITYQRSKREIAALLLRQQFLRPRFAAAILVGILCSAYLINPKDTTFYRAIGVGLLSCVVLLPVLVVFAVFRQARSHWATAPATLRITESGLAHEAAGVKTEMGWEVFRDWSETRDYFLLNYSKLSFTAMMIPKRAFSSEQLEVFIQYLQRIGATPPKISV